MRLQRPRVELDLPIHLDRQAKHSLEQQLLQQLRQAILARQLTPGTRLPSTRSLAQTLGISRTITFTVYDRLVAEGYLVGKHGSGTFVSSDLPHYAPTPRPSEPPDSQQPRWLHHTLPAIVDEGPQIPGTIMFRPGATTLPALSLAEWQATWKRVAQTPLPTDYCSPEGEPALRTAIASYLGRARGITCTPEDIVITSGTAQSLNLVTQATITAGDMVGIEEPGYVIARQIFQAHRAHLLLLPIDDNGVQVSRLPHGNAAPLLVYVTPSHQYPLGSRLSISRRLALLEWAKTNDALIIEDDYDSEFRFDAPPLPALAALDTRRQVVYLGTFSKVLTPAIRCGYLVAPKPLRERIIQLKLLTEYHTSWPLQHTLASFLVEGYLERHIRRMRQYYARCRTALHTTLAPIASVASLRGVEAGLHTYLELHADLNVRQLVREARKQGIVVTNLEEYYAGPCDRQGIVLGYGGLQVPEIVTGAQRLVAVLQKVMRASSLPNNI